MGRRNFVDANKFCDDTDPKRIYVIYGDKSIKWCEHHGLTIHKEDDRFLSPNRISMIC
jgi:hypothetical protein